MNCDSLIGDKGAGGILEDIVNQAASYMSNSAGASEGSIGCRGLQLNMS